MKLHSWNDVPREQMTDLLVRQALHGVNLTISRLDMKAGAVVPTHHHENEQMTVMVSGKLRFIFPDKTIDIVGGEVMEIAPNLPHRVEVLEDSVAIDVFAPVREDWRRGDDAYLRGR
jgi:quercetin dioxygenase-like cupin family protein